jgi:hypothetical protein
MAEMTGEYQDTGEGSADYGEGEYYDDGGDYEDYAEGGYEEGGYQEGDYAEDGVHEAAYTEEYTEENGEGDYHEVDAGGEAAPGELVSTMHHLFGCLDCFHISNEGRLRGFDCFGE